jgi:TRAP transporter 4TM/12TM fusion protein
MNSLAERAASCFTDSRGNPWLILLAGVTSIAFVAAHVFQVFTFHWPSGLFKIIHVGGTVFLLMLVASAMAQRTTSRVIHFLLALAAAAVIVYVFAEYRALIRQRSFLPSDTDLFVALVFLALALYASMREWGWVVSAIAVVGVLYGYFGQWMPEGLLYHGGLTLKRLIGTTSIPYFQGLLGGLSELSAGTIFPFMLFAAALQATGCVAFIMQIAYRIGGRTRAGPAQIAVISSGFMGMVSGSSVANVASTGALTIPLMKKVGFKPEFAGAVESVASTGGQITPPVMGLAAFLIVGMTGIPYGEIVIAAVFPAFIFYAYLMFAVHLRALRFDLDATAQTELTREFESADTILVACLKHLHFFVATIYLVTVLIMVNMPGRAALQAAGILIALYIVRELILSWRGIATIAANTLRLLCSIAYDGALRGAQVAVVVAVIGVLVDILAVTGFSQKLSFFMLELAGGNLALLLVVAAFACLAFGLGLPTSAAYILVALLGAPALVQLGVPLIAAHMFVFFFANISAITPPVAICCLVAAKIAQGSFFRTSFIAVRLGLPGFILPFLFVVHPEILGVDANFATTAFVSLIALVGVVTLNIILEGYLLRPLTMVERVLLLPAALGLLHPSLWASLAGIGVLALVFARQWFALRMQTA